MGTVIPHYRLLSCWSLKAEAKKQERSALWQRKLFTLGGAAPATV